MSFLNRVKAQLKKSMTPATSSGGKYSFGSVDYTIPTIPCIIEKKQDPWVHYGENNLYPIQVDDLRNGSPIHNSIIKTKTKMTAGDGFLINGAVNEAESQDKYDALPPEIKADYDLFFNNPFDADNALTLNNKRAEDIQTQGQYATEVIFNNDFTKIVRRKFVATENIRAGKMVNGKVKSYWFCRDWEQAKKTEFKPVEIFAFDPEDKEHLNQLMFDKLGNGDYYGELPYKGALTWIMIDFKMGIYHLSGIDNGYNPGMHFRFYKDEPDENKRQDIINSLKRAYRGATKTNNPFITFSPSKEEAMDVQPIQVTNLDKQLLLLAELADKKILTGHQLTSPLLAGVSVSGSLGGNTELKVAGTMFDNLSMASDRNFLILHDQRVLDFNKTPIKLDINPFDLFKERVVTKASGGITEAINSLSPLVANKVLESMTGDEIRELVGLKPSTEPIVKQI